MAETLAVAYFTVTVSVLVLDRLMSNNAGTVPASPSVMLVLPTVMAGVETTVEPAGFHVPAAASAGDGHVPVAKVIWLVLISKSMLRPSTATDATSATM